MTRLSVAGALLFIVAGSPAVAQTPEHLMRYPDVNGDAVVFTSEGDLWLGSLSTGNARRLTTDEGTETRAHFSPDGKTLAFTAQYDGGNDVYVMSVEGGAPRRLTWDTTRAEVVGWTPDGRNVAFRSRRDSPLGNDRVYTVPVEGGLPKALPIDRAGLASFSPDGRQVAYTPLSRENATWKRYQGGSANDIWITPLDGKTFRRITDWPGQDQYPLWVGDRVYFASDRDGSLDLYSYDLASGQTARATTHTGFDVKWPNTDGRTIIYQFGAGLEIFDPATGQTRPVSLRMPTDRIHARPRDLSPQQWLTDFGIGPTGKRVVLASRGEIATVPAEKGEVQSVAPEPGGRDQSPSWSPDGKSIAFVSDRSGEQQVYVVPSEGGEPRAVTALPKTWFLKPVWSPDSRTLAVATRDLRLYLVTLGDKPEAVLLDSAPRENYGGYAFSPDSRWLAFDRPEANRYRALYLYDTKARKATRLTDGRANDYDPAFDPEGKVLYFLSDRNVAPRLDPFDFDVNHDNPTRVRGIVLARDTPSPFLAKSDTEAAAREETSKKEAEKKEEKKPDTPPTVKVDLDGITGRVIDVPADPGWYSDLAVAEGRLILARRKEAGDSDEEHGAPAADSILEAFDLEKREKSTLVEAMSGFDLSADRKKVLVRAGNSFRIINAAGDTPADKGAVDLAAWQVRVDPAAEWRQMFGEAWRLERDFMYDPAIHGVDWNAVRTRYEALLPAVGSRDELTEVIGQMVAEMNVSHSYVGGGDPRRKGTPVAIGRLGADLEPDPASGFYRVVHVFEGIGFDPDTRSPLLAPGVDVRPGHYILAIGGRPVSLTEDPNALLAGKAGRVITLRVNDKPSAAGARDVRVETMASDDGARYGNWVEGRRTYVQSRDPRIAYIHLSDMGMGGLAEFTRQYYASLDRDAMVVDVRSNGGGFVSPILLDRFLRTAWDYYLPRYGMPDYEHPGAFRGRVAVLIDEETGSDGEAFSEGFRSFGRGKIIGRRTWGGLVGIAGFHTLVDGGFVTAPQYATWYPNGQWLVEGVGVVPDIEVANDPASVLAGKDPQLDRAIDVLRQELLDNPVRPPVPPPFENRAGLKHIPLTGVPTGVSGADRVPAP